MYQCAGPVPVVAFLLTVASPTQNRPRAVSVPASVSLHCPPLPPPTPLLKITYSSPANHTPTQFPHLSLAAALVRPSRLLPSSACPWTAAIEPYLTPRASSSSSSSGSSGPARSRGSGTRGSSPAPSGRRRASCSRGPPLRLRPPRRRSSPRTTSWPPRRASWGPRAARGGTRSAGGSSPPGAWRSRRRRRSLARTEAPAPRLVYWSRD